MAVDPVTITTAIITLIDALQRAISLLDDFTNAERRVAVIRNDLVLTHSVLQYIRQQLASAREPPTLLIEGDGNPDATVNLRNILRDNVTQLQADVNALTDELEALGGPGRPETRIGRLIARGQVAWRMSYLERMDQSIVSKRMQLELVHNSLKCQTPDRRASDDDILVATFLRQFLPRRESNESLPVPDFEAQQNIARAVRDGNKAKLETLLQHVSPNCHVTVRGRELSPLHLATKRGDLAMVNFLITHGARIDCCGWDEDTPLTLAISHRHAVVALALIRRGANILLADRQERTPLHHAARENLYAVVQVLIHNGADLNAYDTAGRTPLMNAVRRSDREIQPYDTNVLRVLLRPNRQGTAADPALGTVKDHYTPIHDAAARGHLQDLEVMLTTGQTPEGTGRRLILDSGDRTPLWFAARKGQIDAVKLLLRLGAELQINRPTRDPDHPTVLWAMAAAASSKSEPSLEGVSILLAANANPNTQHPTTNQTLLHYACLTNNLPLLSLLLAHNANPLITDSAGQTPLHYAARGGNEPCLTALLTKCHPHHHPLDINAQDNSGTTPLMLAAEHGHDFLLPVLIHKHHAHPHHRNKSGSTAFYVACARGQTLCAAYLLGCCGADINAQNDKGNTALHVAARMGQVETVAWLVRMGADVSIRSREAFGGLDSAVMGTPAEVVRAAGLEEGVGREVMRVLENGREVRRKEKFAVKRVGVNA